MEPSFQCARIKREDLPRLLQNTVERRSIMMPNLLQEAKETSNDLLAVWRGASTYLPHALVGQPRVLADACAWSAAYLQDVGPLSGLVRLMHPDLLISRMNSEGRVDPHLPGIFVGIILGELFARTSSSSPSSRMTLAAATSTLACALFHEIALGPYVSTHEMYRRWRIARSTVNASANQRIDDCVMTIVDHLKRTFHTKETPRTQSELPFLDPRASVGHGFDRVLMMQGVADAFFADENYTHSKFEELSAEEKVRTADRLLARISSSNRPSQERGMAVACLASITVKGYFAQQALISSHGDSLPEAVVWLGALQGDVPLPALLGAFNGIGWRIYAHLQEPVDVLARPRCDVSLEELLAVFNGKRVMLDPTPSRLTIELAPGVDIVLKSPASSGEKPIKRRVGNKERKDAMAAVEESLQRAMELIADLRRSK